MNFMSDDIKSYDEMLSTLGGRVSYGYLPKKLDLDLKKIEQPHHLSFFIEEPLILSSLSHLRYAFLGPNNIFPIITTINLVDWKVKALVFIVKTFKKAIG